MCSVSRGKAGGHTTDFCAHVSGSNELFLRAAIVISRPGIFQVAIAGDLAFFSIKTSQSVETVLRV